MQHNKSWTIGNNNQNESINNQLLRMWLTMQTNKPKIYIQI